MIVTGKYFHRNLAMPSMESSLRVPEASDGHSFLQHVLGLDGTGVVHVITIWCKKPVHSIVRYCAFARL